MTEVICKNNKLVYSNRICCFDNNSTEIKVEFDKNNILKLVFNFHYNDLGLKYEINSPENGTFILDLHNFTNPLGSGLIKPIQVAKYNGKQISIIFYVYKLEKSNPILDISLYLEK